MISVESKVSVYERDGEERAQVGSAREYALVRSNAACASRVRLIVHGHEVVVSGADLQAAIANAMNTGE